MYSSDRAGRLFMAMVVPFSGLFPLLTHPASSWGVKVLFIIFFIVMGVAAGITNIVLSRDVLLDGTEILLGFVPMVIGLSILSSHGDLYYMSALLKGDMTIWVLSPTITFIVVVCLEGIRRYSLHETLALVA